MRTGNIEFLATDIKEDPLFQKVGGALTNLVEEYETNSGAGSEEPFSPSNSFLQVDDERVVIDFIAESEAAVPALLKELENLGGTDLTSFDKVVSGRFPIEKVKELVEVKYLEFARAAMATTNVGIVTSQADPAMNADTARTTYTVDGDGITVGVLSDSYDDLGGEAADVTSGDLPSNVNVLDDLGGGGIDEGRAMAQLVYDVAPGSDLAFHTAFNGLADFAQGIKDLANAGSDVIVDDVIYFNEPMFQDGIIAQAVDEVVDAGVPYFSSAGNGARQSYESAFRGVPDSQVGIDPDYRWHDFNSGSGVDIFQKITLPPGGGIRLAFQWDQPFKSAGPVGSSNDLDVFLFDAFGFVIALSIEDNIGADAFEFFSYQNPFSFNEDVFLLVGQFLPGGGPTPGFVKYVDFGGDGFNIEYDTNSPTSYGHANAAGAEAVGAAFYDDTPRFGTNPPVIEDFSAAGGVPILFNTNGTRLTTPELRQKPEIVAPDGTNTTFFGSDVEGDGFPNFFGTSAAAPHAAAVAALMLEAKPNATPEEIYAALEKTALDMNDPFTAGSDPGFDNGTGYGLIQADAAIAELLGNAPINGTPGNDVINGTAKNDVINGLGGNDQINGLGGNDQLNGDAGKDRLNGDAGNDQLNGGTGNDILDGGTGNDKMAGGTGNDIYIVAQNKDVVTEAANAGTDEVRSSVTNTLGNNVEKLVLTGAGNINGTGNTLNNSLTGNNGNNTLDGKTGNDTMIGGAGNDVYVVDRVLDVVTEAANAGTDEVRSSVTNTLGNNVEKLVLTGAGNINGTGNTLNNSLTGNNGNNKLNGAGGNDILTGGNGNDQLTGGAGNDQLTGGAGNDQLTGGTGNDQLTGGAGEDWFIFNSTLEKLDTIKDFKSSQKDQIRIDASGFKGGLKANRTLATSQFVIGTGAGDRNDRFIYNDNNGALFFDIDGNKPGGVAQVQIATLTGAPTLAASNIFLF